MDGCYLLNGQPRLALRGGKLFPAQSRTPVSDARYRRVPSGAFVLTAPEVRMGDDGSLTPQATGSHRFVPLQVETTAISGPDVRLLFPKADGIGFEMESRRFVQPAKHDALRPDPPRFDHDRAAFHRR